MPQDPLLFPISYQEVVELYGPQVSKPWRPTVKTPPDKWQWYYQLVMPISSIGMCLKFQQVNAVVNNLIKAASEVYLVGKIGGGEVSATLLWADLPHSRMLRPGYPKTMVDTKSLFKAMDKRVAEPDYPKGRSR